MYHRHFGLGRSPFKIEPDPVFLCLGETHREGLPVLKSGIRANKVFVLLTGEAGTAKTVLPKSLLAGLASDVVVAAVPDPGLALLGILDFLANARSDCDETLKTPAGGEHGTFRDAKKKETVP